MPKSTLENPVKLVPLDQLVLADTNIRTQYPKGSVERLADTIEKKGELIQLPRGTQKSPKRVAIHAGGRRLMALKLLKETGRLPDQLAAGIPVIMTTDDRAAQIEASVMENIERENLTPVQEFRAFQSLVNEGFDKVEIANRFGISERLVRQRLALANVHRDIVTAFEENKLDLLALQAFTIEPDQERQLDCFNALPDWNRSSGYIRSYLTRDEVSATSAVAKFVGLEAYENAGGAVKRDLFDENNASILNPSLLQELAEDKLAEAGNEVAAEGWKWVEPYISYDHQALEGCARIYPDDRVLSAEEDARAEALQEELDRIDEAIGELEISEELDQQQSEELDRLGDKRDEVQAHLNELLEPVFSDDQRAIAGAILYIDRNGLRVERGFVRPEDRAEHADAPSPDDPAVAEDLAKQKSEELAGSVTGDLNIAMEAGLQHAISSNAEVAFLVSTAYLVAKVFPSRCNTETLCYATKAPFTQSSSIAVGSADNHACEYDTWDARLAAEDGDLIAALSQWSPADVRALHAFCAGALYSRNAVRRVDSPDNDHTELRTLLNFDPTSVITADHAMLGRFTKVQLVRALAEMAPDESHSVSAAKPELVAAAAKRAAKLNWLPAMLRQDDAFGRLVLDDTSDPADPAESD
ncbi:ParB/RepB/Spo0J family partition protein [Maricaulis virginensis]|jgi:ParB family chromosome partitioning protein|uniref:DNA-binding protein n=1 Tax=Maricaulis virginensis TaxID=144022 RepID=A0A9W6IQJ6_9PROT|nr:ParB/RepB/Spo0J family partition protein [Maricaulis virginensis]GLK53525.1 DNA-binding protein [Maricaulis virginensis]